MNRVIVTGIGAISPIGNSLQETWSNAKAGKSGISVITEFDVADIPWKGAGRVKNYHAEDYLSQKEINRLDPFIHYAFAAAVMAGSDAGLVDTQLLQSSGVIIGSSRGGICTIEKALQKKYLSQGLSYPSLNSAYLMPSTTISMASSSVAQKLGIAGYCLGISNACASGLNAIGEACSRSSSEPRNLTTEKSPWSVALPSATCPRKALPSPMKRSSSWPRR